MEMKEVCEYGNNCGKYCTQKIGGIVHINVCVLIDLLSEGMISPGVLWYILCCSGRGRKCY